MDTDTRNALAQKLERAKDLEDDVNNLQMIMTRIQDMMEARQPLAIAISPAPSTPDGPKGFPKLPGVTLIIGKDGEDGLSFDAISPTIDTLNQLLATRHAAMKTQYAEL